MTLQPLNWQKEGVVDVAHDRAPHDQNKFVMIAGSGAPGFALKYIKPYVDPVLIQYVCSLDEAKTCAERWAQGVYGFEDDNGADLALPQAVAPEA